jgi:hypothetical protein
MGTHHDFFNILVDHRSHPQRSAPLANWAVAHTAEPNLFQYQFTLIRINAKFQIAEQPLIRSPYFMKSSPCYTDSHVFGIGTMSSQVISVGDKVSEKC